MNLFKYEILVTAMENDYEHIQVGGIFNFGMDYPQNTHNLMHHIDLGWFIETVMIPGRKLRFTYSEQGNRGNYVLTEIETVPRKSE